MIRLSVNIVTDSAAKWTDALHRLGTSDDDRSRAVRLNVPLSREFGLDDASCLEQLEREMLAHVPKLAQQLVNARNRLLGALFYTESLEAVAARRVVALIRSRQSLPEPFRKQLHQSKFRASVHGPAASDVACAVDVQFATPDGLARVTLDNLPTTHELKLRVEFRFYGRRPTGCRSAACRSLCHVRQCQISDRERSAPRRIGLTSNLVFVLCR
eukprot:TRINITY_DN2823_c0_g1_i1.p1 TRINITY_DN2823_c0_g1~~TRINITY_DN2823_c0_g1_i1.p1  ORF type:complete len:214 (+),score=49.45 TRINITY_DN2823_c0_g1_i1:191-832(+)